MKKRFTAILGAALILASCAEDDAVVGSTTENTVFNVLENDYRPSLLTASLIDDGGLSGVTLLPNGTLNIPAGNEAGMYILTYEACAKQSKKKCDTANVNLTLEGAEPVEISATNDAFKLIPDSSESLNLLGNDSIGSEGVSSENVSYSFLDTSSLSQVTLDENGGLVLSDDLPEGEYVLMYEICEIANPSNCDQANIFLTIIPSEFKTIDGLVVSSNFVSGTTETIFELNAETISELQVDTLSWKSDTGQEEFGNDVSFQFLEPGLVTIDVEGVTSEGVELSDTISLLVFGENATLPGVPFPSVIGDINLDAVISQDDLIFIDSFLSGQTQQLSQESRLNGDVNLDGMVSNQDRNLIANMIDTGSQYPRSISPTEVAPLSTVQLITPELADVTDGYEVQIGNSEDTFPLTVFYAGYGNFVVPFDFAGPGTNGDLGGLYPVSLLKNGLVVDSFEIDIEPVAPLPLNPKQEIVSFIESVSIENRNLLSAVNDIFVSDGVDQSDIDIFLAPFQVAANEVESSNTQLIDLILELPESSVPFVYQAYAANGLAGIKEGTSGANAKVIGDNNGIFAATSADECTDPVDRLCKTKGRIRAAQVNEKITEGSCAATIAAGKLMRFARSFLRNKAAKQAISGLTNCAAVEASNSVLKVLGSYLIDGTFEFDLFAGRAVAGQPENASEQRQFFLVTGVYKFNGIDRLCALNIDTLAEDFLAQANQDFLRTSVALKVYDSFVEPLDELSDRVDLKDLVREKILEAARDAAQSTIEDADVNDGLARANNRLCKEEIRIEDFSSFDFDLSDNSVASINRSSESNGGILIECSQPGNQSPMQSFIVEVGRDACLLEDKVEKDLTVFEDPFRLGFGNTRALTCFADFDI